MKNGAVQQEPSDSSVIEQIHVRFAKAEIPEVHKKVGTFWTFNLKNYNK